MIHCSSSSESCTAVHRFVPNIIAVKHELTITDRAQFRGQINFGNFCETTEVAPTSKFLGECGACKYGAAHKFTEFSDNALALFRSHECRYAARRLTSKPAESTAVTYMSPVRLDVQAEGYLPCRSSRQLLVTATFSWTCDVKQVSTLDREEGAV